MSRRRRSYKREIIPDPVYNDVTVTKFVNKIMISGKKSLAQKIFYSALEDLRDKVKDQEPLVVFKKAVDNCKPSLEVRSRRVGGSTYQVPVDVREERRMALAIRWVKTYATARRDKTMAAKLANELLAAYKGEGASVKKRDDTHRMAEANKAFAHFKW